MGNMAISNQTNNAIFNHIADRYDLVNGVLSFGCHQFWRIRLAKALPDTTRRVLDLACGTGAIPLTLVNCRRDITDITGIDIAENMLSVGRERVNKHKAGNRITLITGDALNIPFEENSFDAVTIGFALRNVPDIMKLLTSAYRVLKPAGVFAILEFSRPRNIFTRLMYHLYLILIVPLAGLLLTGNRGAYAHLGQSILKFPDTRRFVKMLRQSGFNVISENSMACGAVTLYLVKK